MPIHEEEQGGSLRKAREGSGLTREEIAGAIRGCLALARELANLEGLLGLDRSQIEAPLYSAASPVAGEAFRSRLLSLAFEAYRREKITRGKLREVANLAGFSHHDVDSLFANTDLDEDAVDVLLPGVEG